MTISNNSEVPTYALNGAEFFDGAFSAVDGSATAEDLTLTGALHYTISKQPVTFVHPSDDPTISQQFSVPMWTDSLTGDTGFIEAVVGRDTYTVLQNDALISAAAEVGQAGVGLINWRGVAVYANRARVALWGTIGDEFSVAGDPHHRIAVMRWSHDGSWSAGFKAFVGRVWCGNIIPAKILGAGRKADVSIRHTKSGEVRVETMSDAIAAATVDVSQYEKIFMRLYDRKVEPQDLDAYLDRLVPIDKALAAAPEHLLTTGQKRSLTIARNKRDAIRSVFEHSPSQENLRWTAAGLWHASIEAMDHRSSGDRGKRMVDGADETAKANALTVALEMYF